MGESLIQPRRVEDDTPMGRKLLFYKKDNPVAGSDGIVRISTG